jgi:ribosomal protein S4
MIKFNKYKSFYKNVLLLNSFPFKKLLKFKRSKWKKFIILFSKINKKKIKKNRFFNFLKKNPKIGSWDRLKKSYKTGLLLKNSISKYYNNSISLKFLKSKLQKKKLLLPTKYLTSPLLRLDIFLWKLCLFSSTRQIQQYIIKKNIILNGSIVSKVCFLKEGDIVHLPNLNFLRSSFLFPYSFLTSFCEVDFYTNTFIIFKNPEQLNTRDFYFLLQYNKINLKTLEFYLRKK